MADIIAHLSKEVWKVFALDLLTLIHSSSPDLKDSKTMISVMIVWKSIRDNSLRKMLSFFYLETSFQF